MKKIRSFIFLFSVIFSLSNCRYDEGPVISFRSVKARLWGSWSVTEYYSDGIDSLQYYKDSCGCKLGFPNPTSDSEENDIVFVDCFNSGKGMVCKYNFARNKSVISIYLQYSLESYGLKSFGPMLINADWEIHRLTKEEFKISALANNHYYIVSFKKIN
jgi:hypothetical protein